MNENEKTPLTEEQLEQAAGGWTENRYNPAECGKHNKRYDNCNKMLAWCDHYRSTRKDTALTNHKCVMGYFDYDLPQGQ